MHHLYWLVLFTHFTYSFLYLYIKGQRIFIHGAAATPIHLIQAMCNHGKKANVRDCEVIHIHTEGPGLYNDPEYDGRGHCYFLV